MLAKIYSATLTGIDCEIVEVEADLARGNPAFNIVGLPDAAIQESKERVRSAIKNSDCKFHGQRITVNLAPADIRKAGPVYDLPIAIGMLVASRQLLPSAFDRAIVIGELALDGKTRPVSGILPIVSAAKKKGFKRFFIPTANAKEAAIVEDVEILPVKSLAALLQHISGECTIPLEPYFDPSALVEEVVDDIDFSHVRGQEHAKRALMIAAAGGHNILMNGPPGSGKTMLARAFRTILPRPTLSEMLEVTKLYSIAGLLPNDQPLVASRPFRSVHHTASAVSIVGGGRNPGPGEISLAHRGVLFLDEMAEFPTQVLEVLRQPLEDGRVTISRVSGTLEFPARFTLVGAMNPCPCGFATDPERSCRCSPIEIARYQKKLSGPLLDRIDIHIEVPRVSFDKLSQKDDEEQSEDIRARVQAARDFQRERFSKSQISSNAEMSSHQVKKYCTVDKQAEDLLKQAVTHFQLSARVYYRILKLARTIADLENCEQITLQQVAEALQYRPKIGGE